MISRWGLNGPALTCDFPPGHCLGSGRGQDGLQSRDQIRQVPADGLPEFFVINLVVNWRSRLSIKQLGLSQDGGSPVVLPVVFEGAPIEQVHRPPQHVFQHQFLSPSARRRSISITKEMTRGKVLYTFYVAVPSNTWYYGLSAALRRLFFESACGQKGRQDGDAPPSPRLPPSLKLWRDKPARQEAEGNRQKPDPLCAVAVLSRFLGVLASWRLCVISRRLRREAESEHMPAVRADFLSLKAKKSDQIRPNPTKSD